MVDLLNSLLIFNDLLFRAYWY